MAQELDFSSMVGHKYRLRNGKVALITSIVGNLLQGIVIEEERKMYWNGAYCNSMDGVDYDIMEVIEGPTINRRKG